MYNKKYIAGFQNFFFLNYFPRPYHYVFDVMAITQLLY